MGTTGGQEDLGPLLAMAPVALPAPRASAGKRSSLAARALIQVALLLGVPIIGFGVVAALVLVNVVALEAGYVSVGLIVATIAVVLGVGRGLLVACKRPPEPTNELEVPAASQPHLHAEVLRLATAARTRPPDRIVFVADANAYVRESGVLWGLFGRRRTLGIGVWLFDALDVSELRSVLAHELGHFAGGDTRLGAIAYRTDQALRQIVGRLGGGGIGSLFVRYWSFQHRVGAKVRRGQELAADRASVRVAGRQAAADALLAVQVAGLAEGLYRSSYLGPAVDSGHCPDDVVGGWRQLITDPHRQHALIELASADRGAGDPHASHPPTPERIRRIADIVDEAEPVRDGRRASALLVDPDGWARATVDHWLRVALKGASLRPMAWTNFGAVVAEPKQRARAASVDGALARIGLGPGPAGVRAAVEAHREPELAAALVAGGWRVEGTADQRRALVQGAITATTVRALLDAGTATWAMSWSGPLTLRTAGNEVIEVDELAQRAVDGHWAPLASLFAEGVAR